MPSHQWYVILEIMVQFCYSRIYIGMETVSCHLLLRMARMKLKKNWANFFKF